MQINMKNNLKFEIDSLNVSNATSIALYSFWFLNIIESGAILSILCYINMIYTIIKRDNSPELTSAPYSICLNFRECS